MGFLDKLKFFDRTPQKPYNKREGNTEYGTSGTSIFSGYIDVEKNMDFQFPHSIEKYEQMRNTDATVHAMLIAIKDPLLSANWFIKPASDSPKDKEIAEFVRYNLFENIDFKDFLREALSYLDFGFYYFEKIFRVSEKGFVEWERFAPRIPNAHLRWTIEGKNWENGCPPGITQQLPGYTDDQTSKSRFVQTEIPWKKLILFTNDQEGNNFEGKSVLRYVYQHYFAKQGMYRIGAIAAERHGAGIPYALMKAGASQAAYNQVSEFLQRVRTNEKTYLVLSEKDVAEFGIKSPDGNPMGGQIESLISHHDRKIYDSILAGFLNLTTGDGGSNALSKDQSSFFLRTLQGKADYIRTKVMKPPIKELVDYNYSQVDAYPTLEVTDIGQISLDEFINSLSAAKNNGLIYYTENDMDKVREVFKLPEISEKQKRQMERDEQKEIEIETEAGKLVAERAKETSDPQKQKKIMERAKQAETEQKAGKDLAEVLYFAMNDIDFIISNDS